MLEMQETWVWSLRQKDPPGVGNASPVQYSCLENSTGRGSQQATAMGHNELGAAKHTHSWKLRSTPRPAHRHGGASLTKAKTLMQPGRRSAGKCFRKLWCLQTIECNSAVWGRKKKKELSHHEKTSRRPECIWLSERSLIIMIPTIWPTCVPGGSAGRESVCNVGQTWIRSLGWEDPLEKGKTTHSSILACVVHGVTKSQTQPSDFHFHFHLTLWKRQNYGASKKISSCQGFKSQAGMNSQGTQDF